MASAVKIPPQAAPGLGFDLEEVLAAVGDRPDLTWQLSEAEVVFPEDAPEATQQLADKSNQQGGVALTWAEMATLASDCLQIIDGRFVGRREGEPMLSIAAIDSSYWIVWAADSSVLDRVRQAFRGVEDYDEPAPSD